MRGILDRLNVDLPFLTCCTCSLMLNRGGAHNVRDDFETGSTDAQQGGVGGLITFLRSLRQGPRNLLSLFYRVDFPVCVVPCPHVPMPQCPHVPLVSNPEGWSFVDDMWFMCPNPPSPHAPMSPCPNVRPPCPLSVKH